MLATAAVADSRWKDAKLEEWDKAIAKVRDELRDIDTQQQSRLAALPNKPGQEQMIKETKGAHWGDVFEWASRQREARKALGFQDWKGIPLDLLEGLSRSDLQRALEDSRISARLTGEAGSAAWSTESHGRPLSPKKLRTLEWSVAKMVTQLLSQISNDGLGSRDGIERPENTLPQQSSDTKPDFSGAISKIDERLSELQEYSQSSEMPESLESPQYPQYGDGSGNDPRVLNASLRAILRTNDLGKDSKLAKICFNLLMSPIPPNVHTYNTIIVNFCRMGEQDIVSAVLTSMRESHIRPNEVTHSITLKLFTLAQNSTAFVKYVRLMEGLDQGFAIAHPKTKRIPITAGRYRFPEDFQNPVAQFARDEVGAPVSVEVGSDTQSSPRRTKIFEKARVNQEVYGALIHGALRFWGKEQAMQFYRAMVIEGWHPNVNILTSLLRHCCYEEDWPSGVAVWQEIKRLTHGANEKAYLWMLRLCRRCHEQKTFEEVLSDGTQCGVLPSTVWDLGTKIETAEVSALINIAKRIRGTQRSQQAQLAARNRFAVGLEVEQHSNLKTISPIEVSEPSPNETQSERSSIPLEVISTEHSPHGPAIPAPASPSKHYQPVLEAAIVEPIALDPPTSDVPTHCQRRPSSPSPGTTVNRGKEQTQRPTSNLPIVYRSPQTPQVIPDQFSWGTYEGPLAANA